MGFLCLFMLELAVRLYAWGPVYLRDPFNVIDAVIIIGSFSVSIVVFSSVFAEDSNGDSVRSTSQITRLVRIVRVFRLLTAMTKFQKNRANTDVRRKKAKYRKTGSYVERVIDILQKLRNSSPFMEHNEDRENLNFISEPLLEPRISKMPCAKTALLLHTPRLNSTRLFLNEYLYTQCSRYSPWYM